MVSFLTVAFIYLVEEEMQLQSEIDVLPEQIESSDRKPTIDTISLYFVIFPECNFYGNLTLKAQLQQTTLFFYFSEKTRLDNSCESSAKQK